MIYSVEDQKGTRRRSKSMYEVKGTVLGHGSDEIKFPGMTIGRNSEGYHSEADGKHRGILLKEGGG